MFSNNPTSSLCVTLCYAQLEWTQTQPGGLSAQLDCGARAFDARPAVDRLTGHLVWHHGGVIVPHNFSASLEEVVSWCAAHPTELVLMTVRPIITMYNDPHFASSCAPPLSEYI